MKHILIALSISLLTGGITMLTIYELYETYDKTSLNLLWTGNVLYIVGVTIVSSILLSITTITVIFTKELIIDYKENSNRY